MQIHLGGRAMKSVTFDCLPSTPPPFFSGLWLCILFTATTFAKTPEVCSREKIVQLMQADRNEQHAALATCERACSAADQDVCSESGFFYALGVGVEKDARKASSIWKKLCETGYHPSCAILALQMIGSRNQKDSDESLKLAKRACQAGVELACGILEEVLRDAEARSYWSTVASPVVARMEQACLDGDVASCEKLASRLKEGKGIAQDLKRSLAIVSDLCQRDHACTCVLAGKMIQEGMGIQSDPQKAQQMFERGCKLGNKVCCVLSNPRIGDIFDGSLDREYHCSDPKPESEVKKKPMVKMGDPTIVGSLSKEIVQAVITRHLEQVRFCYMDERPRLPDFFGGELLIQLMIDPDGRTSEVLLVKTSLNNAKVEQCLLLKIQKWKFPSPKDRKPNTVSFPLVFSPES
jgi:TPR repeat protein